MKARVRAPEEPGLEEAKPWDGAPKTQTAQ